MNGPRSTTRATAAHEGLGSTSPCGRSPEDVRAPLSTTALTNLGWSAPVCASTQPTAPVSSATPTAASNTGQRNPRRRAVLLVLDVAPRRRSPAACWTARTGPTTAALASRTTRTSSGPMLMARSIQPTTTATNATAPIRAPARVGRPRRSTDGEGCASSRRSSGVVTVPSCACVACAARSITL